MIEVIGVQFLIIALLSLWATPSAHAKSCKIQKVVHFTYFEQKHTHISGCKIVYKCTSVTVTVYICTVTVARAFNILVFFGSVRFVRERGSEWGNNKKL